MQCQRVCSGDRGCVGQSACQATSPALIVEGQSLGTCCALFVGEVCNGVTDCGCADGQTCSLGGTGCRALSSTPSESYGACRNDMDCPALHSCIDGVCKRHCRAAADCGSSGAQCVSTSRTYPVCTRHCDPAAPQQPRAGFQPCGAGLTCINYSNGSTDCLVSAGGARGASCTVNTDCAPGSFCNTNDGTCLPWCVVGGTACADGGPCISLATPITVDGVELGACTG